MGIFDKIKNLFSKNETEKENISLYDEGLSKTRGEFNSKLNLLTLKYNKIDEAYYEELEEILIMADIGVNTVEKFIDKIRKRVNNENITSLEDLKEIIVDEMLIIYVNNDILTNKIHYNESDLTVILFVGVNGVGKTTSMAKLANKMNKEGKRVLLVAADTFRAGAIEQLETWSERIKTDIFKSNSKDPSSVIYDALIKAKKDEYDVVLVDTAGRLQNKDNLMSELNKMNKVISNLVEGGTSETLLVLDATTGQNGISQAKSFKEITNITGIILTKLDGTARGGIVMAIKESVNIPVKFIGLGEGIDDLTSFDIEKYIYGLFKDVVN